MQFSFRFVELQVFTEKLLSRLTHWGRDNMAAIFQMTYSKPFSSMKIFVFWLIFQAPINNIQHWFRYWFCTGLATSHYLNQWWPILMKHVWVTQPQWGKYFPLSKVWHWKRERERERLSLSAFLRTEDIGVHIVHISRLIITYTLE